MTCCSPAPGAARCRRVRDVIGTVTANRQPLRRRRPVAEPGRGGAQLARHGRVVDGVPRPARPDEGPADPRRTRTCARGGRHLRTRPRPHHPSDVAGARCRTEAPGRGTSTWRAYATRTGRTAVPVVLSGSGRTPRDHRGLAGCCGPGRRRLADRAAAGCDASVLWDRFASVLGVDRCGLRPGGPSNPSLGLAALLVLRQLNERLAAREQPLGQISTSRWSNSCWPSAASRAVRGHPARATRPTGSRVGATGTSSGCGSWVPGWWGTSRTCGVARRGTRPDEVNAGQQLDAALDAVQQQSWRWPVAREVRQ